MCGDLQHSTPTHHRTTIADKTREVRADIGNPKDFWAGLLFHRTRNRCAGPGLELHARHCGADGSRLLPAHPRHPAAVPRGDRDAARAARPGRARAAVEMASHADRARQRRAVRPRRRPVGCSDFHRPSDPGGQRRQPRVPSREAVIPGGSSRRSPSPSSSSRCTCSCRSGPKSDRAMRAWTS